MSEEGQMKKSGELELDQFPIVHVAMTENNAIVTRTGETSVQAGQNLFELKGLSGKLQEDSINITMNKENVRLQNPSVQQREELKDVDEQVEDLKSKISKKEDKLSKLNIELNTVKSNRKSTKDVLRKTGMHFLSTFSEKVVTLDQLVKIVKYLDDELQEELEEYIRIEQKINEIQTEIEELEKEVEEIKEETGNQFYDLTFNLIAAEKVEAVTVSISYRVPSTWKPSYDLNISDESAKITFWGIIINDSLEPWNDVEFEIYYSSFGEVSINHPEERELEIGVEVVLDKDYQRFQSSTNSIKGLTTHVMKPKQEKISIPADNETHAYLMERFETDPRILYYWNAAETDYVVLGVEFTHRGFDLLEGECNFFRDDQIIGRGTLPNLIRNQKVKLPISVETGIIATKRLLKQESSDDKHISLSYQLQMVNKAKRSFEIEVTDILPLSAHPDSEISMTKTTKSPDMRKEGMLQWSVQIDDLWSCNYDIEIYQKETKKR